MLTSNSTRCGGSFDDGTIQAVWEKGRVLSYANPAFIRADAYGALMRRDLYGRIEDLGWEIDHIRPKAKDGTDHLSNLQPLQWENNRSKSDQWPWTYPQAA